MIYLLEKTNKRHYYVSILDIILSSTHFVKLMGLCGIMVYFTSRSKCYIRMSKLEIKWMKNWSTKFTHWIGNEEGKMQLFHMEKAVNTLVVYERDLSTRSNHVESRGLSCVRRQGCKSRIGSVTQTIGLWAIISPQSPTTFCISFLFLIAIVL